MTSLLERKKLVWEKLSKHWEKSRKINKHFKKHYRVRSSDWPLKEYIASSNTITRRHCLSVYKYFWHLKQKHRKKWFLLCQLVAVSSPLWYKEKNQTLTLWLSAHTDVGVAIGRGNNAPGEISKQSKVNKINKKQNKTKQTPLTLLLYNEVS